MKLKSHILPILLLIILTIIAHNAWFTNLSAIAFGDSYQDFIEKAKEYLALPLIWHSDGGLGMVNIGISFWPLLFLGGILANLNIPVFIGARIQTLWPIAILTPVSMYFLSYYILKSRLGGFISALVFTFNSQSIIGRAILTSSLAGAFFPLFFLAFMLTLNKKRVEYLICTVFLGFIISFHEFRFFYIIVWLLFFYSIYHSFFLSKKGGFISLFKIGLIFSLIIGLILLLNSYFLLSIIGSKSLASNPVFNRGLTGQEHVNTLHSLLLYYYLWSGGVLGGPVNVTVIIRFFFIPILVIIGFLTQKKNILIPFFMGLALLGIFLTKQEALPFPHIYNWLYINLPGFNAFRESTKFYSIIIFSYSILIGACTLSFWRWAKNTKQKIIAGILILLTAFLFLWNIKPLLTGEIGNIFTQREIPKDYIFLKNFILNQKDYFRTYWVPHLSHWSFNNHMHPIISNHLIINNDWISFYNTDAINPFTKPFSNQLFDISSIKYAVLIIDSPGSIDDYYKDLGKRSIFYSALKKSGFFKEINIGTKQLTIFENENYRPHLYLTKQKETIYKNIPYQKINFSFINPALYKIHLKNLSKPFYLNFSDTYHPDWKLIIGQFNWFNALTEKNYFLTDKNHFKNDAGLNSFYLDPASICKLGTACKKNPNGSYDVDLTLYVRLQSYVYLGTLISLSTFIGCIFVLVWALFKRVKSKKIT